MAPVSLLGHSTIRSVTFSISGTEDVRNSSVIRVTNEEQIKDGQPQPNGVSDAHMGTPSKLYKCATCRHENNLCPGHNGHVDLNYPVIQTLHLAYAKKILKIVCHDCKKFYNLYDEDVMKKRRKNRLAAMLKKVKSSKTTKKRVECPHCGALRPTIERDATSKFSDIFPIARYYEDKVLQKTIILYPHVIKDIFTGITKEDADLVFEENFHPSNLTLDAARVPPMTMRPNSVKIGSTRKSGNDLTSIVQLIVKKNNDISGIPAEIDENFERVIYDINSTYSNFIKSPNARAGDSKMSGFVSSNLTSTSILNPIKHKEGIPRANLMGKRTFNTDRSVITCDPTKRNDQVGYPKNFARALSVPMVVRSYNMSDALMYYDNGLQRYPGCTGIIEKNTGRFHAIDAKNKPLLTEGDKLMRNLVDGDPVLINRPPTMMGSNIMGHNIVINDVKTKRINSGICAAYGADFDGDQMSGFIPMNIMARNEVATVGSMRQWFISKQTSTPFVGQMQDALLALAFLTRSDTRIDLLHTRRLFSKTNLYMDLNKPVYSGRDIMSMILPPINFSGKSNYYNPSFAPYVKYVPDEMFVDIKNGKLLSGILDKSSIGEGSDGGVFHITAIDYGIQTALDVIHNMQQIALSFLVQKSNTLSLQDLVISKKTKDKIHEIENGIYLESDNLTKKLYRGEIIPPIDQTVTEFYEKQQIGILTTMDLFVGPILEEMDHRNNNLFSMIMYGVKGKPPNLYNMVAAVGQITINGKRLPHNFSFKRSLIYFPRFETDPQANGNIPNSYLDGQDAVNIFASASQARNDLTVKALSTSIGGEANRICIKNSESAIIDNRRFVMISNKIVQFMYGDTGMDVRNLENVIIPSVMMSDADLEKKYKYHGTSSGPLQDVFDKEFAQIKADRDFLRTNGMNIEKMNKIRIMGNKFRIPMNVFRIVHNVSTNQESVKQSTEELISSMSRIETFCREMMYLYFNEEYFEAKLPIPAYVKSSFKLLHICIRLALCSNVVENLSSKTLDIIFDNIAYKYSTSLVAYGEAAGITAAECLSEPFTQYMLDAHHRTGGSGGTQKEGIRKYKEVLGVKGVDKAVNPSMFIRIDPQFNTNKQFVQNIANNIESSYLELFTSSWLIFFESFGEPVHPKYKYQKEIISQFVENSIQAPPQDLSKWVILYKLKRTNMILKNITIEQIALYLMKLYPETYLVYTPDEYSGEPFIRVYFSNRFFKKDRTVTLDVIKEFAEEIIKETLRGVKGITSCKVVNDYQSEILPDGSVSQKTGIYAIETIGTNLYEVLKYKYLDYDSIQSDNIQETYKMFGIKEAEQKIINIERSILSLSTNVTETHYKIMAAIMTMTGKPTPIKRRVGPKSREKDNALLRISDSYPIQNYIEACQEGIKNKVYGISAPLMLGAIPKIGTLFNKFIIDTKFIQENASDISKVVEEL
jgi:DNA-directed RNA polymerase II subunit RPB1